MIQTQSVVTPAGVYAEVNCTWASTSAPPPPSLSPMSVGAFTDPFSLIVAAVIIGVGVLSLTYSISRTTLYLAASLGIVAIMAAIYPPLGPLYAVYTVVAVASIIILTATGRRGD
jgi:hypothetical protein